MDRFKKKFNKKKDAPPSDNFNWGEPTASSSPPSRTPDESFNQSIPAPSPQPQMQPAPSPQPYIQPAPSPQPQVMPGTFNTSSGSMEPVSPSGWAREPEPEKKVKSRTSWMSKFKPPSIGFKFGGDDTKESDEKRKEREEEQVALEIFRKRLSSSKTSLNAPPYDPSYSAGYPAYTPGYDPGYGGVYNTGYQGGPGQPRRHRGAPDFDYINWKPYGVRRSRPDPKEEYATACRTLAPWVNCLVTSACMGMEERRWYGMTLSADDQGNPYLSGMNSRYVSQELL